MANEAARRCGALRVVVEVHAHARQQRAKLVAESVYGHAEALCHACEGDILGAGAGAVDYLRGRHEGRRRAQRAPAAEAWPQGSAYVHRAAARCEHAGWDQWDAEGHLQDCLAVALHGSPS